MSLMLQASHEFVATDEIREQGSSYARLQRVLDVCAASILLLILAPLMMLVAAWIMMTDRGPVLFGHRRIGREGRTFLCWKFRSMVVDGDQRLEQLLSVPAVLSRRGSY